MLQWPMMTNNNATLIQTSTRNSLLLAGRLVIVKLVESFRGVFAPEVPEGEQTEGKRCERTPVASEDGHAVVVYRDDDEGTGDGYCIGRVENDLEHQGFEEPLEKSEPEGKSE